MDSELEFQMPSYFAHRGDTTLYPENSLQALAAAIASGAPGVEIDVRRCKDGFVVFHDDTLERLVGRSDRICDLTKEQLHEISLSKDAAISIPSLEQALDSALGKGVLNIELKDSELHSDFFALLDVVKDWSQLLFSSFEISVLRDIRKHLPQAPIAILLREDPRDFFNLAEELAALAFHVNISRTNLEMVRAIHNFGCKIGLYPIDTADLISEAKTLEVDCIFCRSVELANSHWVVT